MDKDVQQAVPVAQEVPGEGWSDDWKAFGFNGAIRQAQEALRYLANNDRPSGGEQFPNSACCYMIADELEITRKRYAALASFPCKSGEGAGATIRDALQAYRSLPAGTVREFPMLEARANDPNDSAHGVLTARLPGLRDEYETAKAKLKDIDAALASLSAPNATQTREAELPDDVRALVIAAREFWDDENNGTLTSHALDKALEPFSSRVPYDDEPCVARGGA